MKKSVLMVFTLLALLILPSVLADASISIKTLPDHRVSVIVRNAGSLSTIDSLHKETGPGTAVNPDYVIVDYTPKISNTEVDLLVTLKKDGVEILKEKYYEVSTSDFININLLPGETGLVDSFDEPVEEEVVEEVTEDEEASDEVEETTGEVEETSEAAEEEVVEEVVEESNEAEEESSEVTAGITGNAVQNVKDVFSSKTPYYILGAIVGIFALVFIIQVGRKKLENGGSYKVVKWGGSEDRRLADAERKLAEAKKELDQINARKKKLAQAKERFQKDREELRKLED